MCIRDRSTGVRTACMGCTPGKEELPEELEARRDAADPPVRIRFELWTGHKLELDIRPHDATREWKPELLQECISAEQIASIRLPEALTLEFEGVEVGPAESLADHGIQPDAVITVTKKPVTWDTVRNQNFRMSRRS
eukprot:TRINITY_DN50189_c0_g1_i2.p1 TRINITY_DN50189_c0_g1~~TRINITY_DN50189_c0_g1_i2.p1  ORF type:complete len:137 (+),score=34.47 TRINITY_DN50189_c0_g1_i2:132-542(+)